MSCRFVVISLLTCATACGRDARPLRVLDLVALDDGSSVVLWTDGERDRVSRTAPASTRFLWSRTLEQWRHRVHPPVPPFVVDRNVVVTRTNGPAGLVAEGVSLDGSWQWTAPLGRVDPGQVRNRLGLATNGEILELFTNLSLGGEDVEQQDWLVTLDARTGREVRRIEITRSIAGIEAVRGRPFLRSTNRITWLSPKGELQPVDGHSGCVLGQHYWGAGEAGDVSVVLTNTDDKLRSITIATNGNELDDVLACARIDDRIVVVVQLRREETEWSEVHVLREDGSFVARLELRELWTGRGPIGTPTQSYQWPRFAPLLNRPSIDQKAARDNEARDVRLDIVDLYEGRIVASTSVRPYVIYPPVGDRWYVLSPGASGLTITALDGATGHVLAAKQLGARRGSFELTPWAVSAQGIWLLNRADGHDLAKRLVKLDPVTLERVAGAEIDITDVRSMPPWKELP